MRVVKQDWKYLIPYVFPNDYYTFLRVVEGSARTCYQSVGNPNKTEEFVRNLIKRKHLSPLEHVSISVNIITDRAVLAELTRHRLATYSVESQRFVRYDKGIEFVLPIWFNNVDKKTNKSYTVWEDNCKNSELHYNVLIELGQQPQQARMVLNNSTKVSLVMTANIREWRHILHLRTRMDNNPQMRELMVSILTQFAKDMPVFFEDILEK